MPKRGTSHLTSRLLPLASSTFTKLVGVAKLTASAIFLLFLPGCAHLPSASSPSATNSSPADPSASTEAHSPPQNRAPRWPDRPLKGANIGTEITEEDLRHFAQDWRGQAVRVLHLALLSDQPPHAVDETALNAMYNAAALALDQGLAVVFAPGIAMDDNDRFFSSKTYKAAFVEFWKKVADHFKAEKRTIAFDLMNEPHDRLAQTEWSGFAKELTREIRKIDPVHTLIVEPQEWGWPAGFDYLEPTGDDNTVWRYFV